jgi:hypothetical protein
MSTIDMDAVIQRVESVCTDVSLSASKVNALEVANFATWYSQGESNPYYRRERAMS